MVLFTLRISFNGKMAIYTDTVWIFAYQHCRLAYIRWSMGDVTHSANITRYLDIHYAHLAAYAGAGDDSIPLMTVETFPRLPGGVRAALDSLQ